MNFELKPQTQKALQEKPLFSNNSRRRAGLKTRRKPGPGKRYRYLTRREPWEAVSAFLDYVHA